MRRVSILVCGVAFCGFIFLGIHFGARNPSATDQFNGSAANVPPIAIPASEHEREVVPQSGEQNWFLDVTPESGITFRHVTGTSAEKPFPAANGSGLAAVDFDRDGWLDLYFLTGTPFPLDPQRQQPTNRLFRQLTPWHFADVSEKCGLASNGYSAGVAVGDYDQDGFPDVYVACYGTNCLYRNFGDGTYVEVGAVANVADPRWATSTCFIDYDEDGLLDIYVCNYGKWTLETNAFCGDRQRNVRIYCSPTSIEPEMDVLFRNLGDGTFAEVTSEAGIGSRASRSQGVVAADLNDDGRVDLYVGNDMHANSLFLNRGNGRFDDASEDSGSAYNSNGNTQAGMGVDAADFNADGRIDLFVTNFQNEYNTLYENLGNELFADTTSERGLAADSIPWVGWGTAFADFNLDGWLDVVVTNGHVDDNRHLLGQDASYAQPPLLWQNFGGQLRCLKNGGGTYFAKRHVGRALVVADLDNDGDQDLVLGHQDGPPALLRNEALQERSNSRAIVLRLIGTSSNRDAVGSTITRRDARPPFVRQVKGGGSYLSASDLRVFFTTASASEDVWFRVRWPNGRENEIGPLVAGREYLVEQPFEAEQARARITEVRQ